MLELRFSLREGRVQLSCDPGSVAHLQALRSRFLSAESISQLTFDVELDDLLVNLYELAAWPSEDADVRWQPELRTLVETNAGDAQVFEERLDAPGDGGIVDVRLGPWWKGDLTDFQQRDLKKLLGLSHGANFSVPGAGKTRVALGVFQHRRENGEIERMLVVCPKSAFEAWHEETSESFSQSA